MQLYLVCFDIEDNRTRRNVGNRLLQHGQRVQHSVFEVLLSNAAERDKLADELHSLLDELDDLRFYPLCQNCRHKAYRSDGQRIARFPPIHVI